MAQDLEVRFDYDKETKNTVVFKEDKPIGSEVVGSLYIKKHALTKENGEYPSRVTIKITI